jgi:hypothetical protein
VSLYRIICAVLIICLATSVTGIASDGNHVVLGGEEGDGMIFNPRQVEEGPDGNLYVLDSGDSFIKVYSPDGEYLRKIAGSGEGPGEFQRVDGATFGFLPDNRLFFTEFLRGHRWITTMELNGDFVSVLSPELDVEFGVEAATPLADGGFLVQFVYTSTPRASGDYFLYYTPKALVRINSEGEIVSEVVATENAELISNSSDGATTNLPFTPRFTWAPFGNEEVVWSDGMSPTLRVLDYSGGIEREINSQLPVPEKVTKQDLEEWKLGRKEMMMSRNVAWWNEFGRVVESYDKPLYDKPVLRRLSVTPAGNLLCEGPWNSKTEETTYWLLDPDGVVVQTVSAGAGQLHFSAHYTLFFTVDEDGTIRVHAADRKAGEADDLSQLKSIVDSDDD